ncbi:hypothetical protein OnM2_020011 [Erysiphe neolycopersici]|uniref:Uncharacterized protein n=1 Tax=Erysiphe neolycopersici TaxID=212602 RepID=A0A420I3C1_9PEZI|nr:hypothetical protein OnM2_020011 [Erysiphe neolycopersici]
MVADKKVSLLPAPTESDSATGVTEFESRITNKTSFSLPEDGSPITIATRRRRPGKDGLGLNSNKSQTSLLIEYFEGSKSGQMESRRPSVRVKVRPSSKIRSRSSNDRIQISERKSTRKTSYTKQNQLSSNYKNAKPSEAEGDNQSTWSHRSATEESNSNLSSKGSGSIEVEITPRRHGSPLIPVIDTRLRTIQINPSEISSVPDDSFLDGKVQSSNYRRSLNSEKNLNTFSSSGFKTGKVIDHSEMPLRSRSRSLSRERIVVQKAVEKVRNENSEQRRRKHSSRSRSLSSDIVNEPIRPLKKLIPPQKKDILASGADSSLLNSHLSAKSGEAYSLRSGTSRSSMNNPKLLETVEDAIRRLILPELTALKREQSRHIHRNRRNSITSCSGISKDSNEFDLTEKKPDQIITSDIAIRPDGGQNNSETLSKSSAKWLPDDKHAGYVEDSSATVYERETIIETVIRESGRLQSIRNQDNLQGLTITEIEDDIPEPLTGLLHKNSHDSFDREERKGLRRRNKSRSRSHSRSNSFSNAYHETNQGNPQMPLLHEINPSEITRSSILSAPSETMNSTNKEPHTPLREVSRVVVSPISRTPNRTPVSLQHVLGTQHSNISRGNLSLHGQQSEPQLRSTAEYDLDEYGQKIIKENLYPYESVKEDFHHKGNIKFHSIQISDHEDTADESPTFEENHNQDTGSAQDKSDYFYQEIQEVPSPLRYVPYAYERRGLSPIQSVSGYTDGEPENKRDSQLTRSSGSYSSIGRHAMQRRSVISTKSLESIGSQHNPYDFPDVRQGGLADSEITQDLEYWEEQRRENDRNRRMDRKFQKISKSKIEYQHQTKYTEEHMEERDKNLSVFNHNQNITHADDSKATVALELIETEFVDRLESYPQTGEKGLLTPPSRSEKSFERSKVNIPRSLVLDKQQSNVETSDIKKLESQVSFTTEEALKSAATAALENRRRNLSVDEGRYDDDGHEISKLIEQKSFKERAMEISGQSNLQSPEKDDDESTHREIFQMSASGIPDLNDPMPEIGFGHRDSEVLTNPSIIGSPKCETRYQTEERLSAQCRSSQSLQLSKSTQRLIAETTKRVEENVRETDKISIEGSENAKDFEAENGEEWHRDSLDRKRDTIVTNPYENTSPVTAGDMLDQHLPDFKGFIPSKLSLPERDAESPKNEGYKSPLPNRSSGALTPEPETADRNCDPFYTPKHQRNFSGMSQGMSSPLYDSATGNGIDRIESRDIVALMDHLTVRDAQRSARDTEILVTLVRAAAEMRNSFEDMKRLLADTEDVIITEVQTNTEKSVQKVMYGPRPPPQSGRRSLRPGSYHEICEDIPAKKRNVFRRALKGLSMKSANDLGKIEEMLVQLLGEVEGLKVAQGLKPNNHRTESHDLLNRETHIYEGHEPESNTSFSTVENGSPPGHGHRETSRVSSTRTFDIRKNIDHRFSTVMEGNEDDTDSEVKLQKAQQIQKNGQPSTPLQEDVQKGKSHPSTPVEANLPGDQHNLPVATEKSKKYKSGSSSSWIPKVSRWSETTASTVFRGFRSSVRSSIRKADDASPPSRSGSESGQRSENRQSSGEKLNYGSSHDQFQHLEGTETSIPYNFPEDPKYKAHRDSKNLQHPQPRLGSTDHHQTTLETQVDNFESRTPPSNSEWDREKNKNKSSMQQRNSYSGNMSPISDGEYSASNQPPSKPSQENLGYDRSTKVRAKPTKPSPLSNESLAEELRDIPSSPPRHVRPLHCIPTRRPTGPRTMFYPQSDCCDQKNI